MFRKKEKKKAVILRGAKRPRCAVLRPTSKVVLFLTKGEFLVRCNAAKWSIAPNGSLEMFSSILFFSFLQRVRAQFRAKIFTKMNKQRYNNPLVKT